MPRPASYGRTCDASTPRRSRTHPSAPVIDALVSLHAVHPSAEAIHGNVIVIPLRTPARRAQGAVELIIVCSRIFPERYHPVKPEL
jgi:hypothetical protein